MMSTADAQSSSNSLVRFRISHGSTFFGDVDVELFDREKPQTVANFLTYVQSGAYDNSILHGLYPGFTLMGGFGAVANPYSSAPFDTIQRVPANAPITNEFNVVTVRSNTFGTIAMALRENDPNSASSEYFFHLGNNTNFDVRNYTVFGRTIAGTSTLASFNKFTNGNGILPISSYTAFCQPILLSPDNIHGRFSALPVSYDGFGCPAYKELFNVQILL